VAIALYPGGTWYDAQAVGHSWWKNFLCDLMQTRALNGEAAPVGSALARLGMVAMLAALAAFYELVARLEQPMSRDGRVARVAGWTAAGLGLLVPVATSDQFRMLHLLTVVGAFVPSVVATVAALRVCLRVEGVSPWIRWFAMLTLGAGALDGCLYAFAYAAPPLGLVPSSPVVRAMVSASLPLFQRIATLAVLAWMISVCVHAWAPVKIERELV
jgi:hypothetical protein